MQLALRKSLPSTAIAHLSPSIAAVTIPPAYPAPSPQGYKPFTLTDESVSSLTILTGEELLVSGPVMTASGKPKQLIFSKLRQCEPQCIAYKIG